jgi:hypothetical protein
VRVASNRDPVLVVEELPTTTKESEEKPCLNQLVTVDGWAKRINQRVKHILLLLHLQCCDTIYSVNWEESELPRGMPLVTRMFT